MSTQFSRASLYVGNLALDVDENTLYQVFSRENTVNVSSIRVLRDNVTRRSLGYAYVNFMDPEDAKTALNDFNFALLNDRPMRIMWSQRDPTLRKTGEGNVFVCNLDASIDDKALHDAFAEYGNILSCAVKTRVEKRRVKNDQTGEEEPQQETLGQGFVHFEKAEDAEKAIAAMNGMIVNGKKIFVGPFKRKAERFNMGVGPDSYTNIIVKNLDESVTDEELAKLFSKCGEIQHAAVSTDPATNKSLGYGFVNYKDHAAAVRAIDELNDYELNGKKLLVARHLSKRELMAQKRNGAGQVTYEGRNLYVKNLDDAFTDERLRAEFKPFGEIESAKIMRDERGASRGFGFVCFVSADDATKALTDMNGRMIGTKPLYVSLAQRKAQRAAQLAAVHGAGMPGMPGGMAPQFMALPPGVPPGMIPPGMMPPGYGPYPGGPGAFGPMGGPMGPPFNGQPPSPSQQAQQSQQQGGRPYGGGRYQQGGAPFPGGAPTRGGRGGRGGAQGGRGGKGRYNQGVRNQRPIGDDQQQQQQQQAAQQTPQQAEAGTPSLANLANLPSEEQKRVLGEQLFPQILAAHNEDVAARITGMLLEMDNADIIELLESPDALMAKVNEAFEVLQQHLASEQAAAEGGAQ